MTSNATTVTDGPLPDASAKEVPSAGTVQPNRSPSKTRNPLPMMASSQEIPSETTITVDRRREFAIYGNPKQDFYGREVINAEDCEVERKKPIVVRGPYSDRPLDWEPEVRRLSDIMREGKENARIDELTDELRRVSLEVV
ncbi:uncharacterized protein L3040_007797 [Drepanopeziza brunnea f. sp. 'multigermtubi']|uniref:Uncharacterized protein n=1 Tax=Marssonina brunnea f. sp. multigermtubi (strain MB_m1) TaxID=1072389 RepID=K1X651_MARBU|nr:uncharacterized protein MBM_05407 [Drepanopeziza brunnea f. sp. 'multigermtubi' MB_m1]EKD16113.1 hypothetical protein MBM_05407 [Drepanopeziza brunnea f. sp. 'multigermtubi' MB_m1]KAJ5035322.1 hypothetical protein L3040_007797 [Drepanopeziza brunnea f. sp. 'multigermtubi']